MLLKFLKVILCEVWRLWKQRNKFLVVKLIRLATYFTILLVLLVLLASYFALLADKDEGFTQLLAALAQFVVESTHVLNPKPHEEPPLVLSRTFLLLILHELSPWQQPVDELIGHTEQAVNVVDCA